MPKEQKLKVLVVEDNEPVREVIRALLEEEFYVLTAPTGAEALDILRQHKDVVVVTTSTLRGQLVNGFVLLREIKKRHPRVKVILVTGASAPEIPDEIKTLFSAIVYKPFLELLPPVIAVLVDDRVGMMRD